MKLIVMSDSHGFHDRIEHVLHVHPDADAYLHCGDIECSESMYPTVLTVMGNNDFFYQYPRQRILKFGEYQVLMMHGNQFSYYDRLQAMASYAKEHACDIMLFGHSHVACHEIVNGVHLINPGSLWRSRDNRPPSYAIVTLEPAFIDVQFVFLD